MSGGGSGSSGGGTSGTVDYPAYMKTFHGLILDGGGADSLSNSVTDAINALYGNSPFTGLTAYDPDTDLGDMQTAIGALSSLVVALDYATDYGNVIDTAVAKYDSTIVPSATHVTNRIAALAADLDAALNATVLPAFRAGMRDIGSVMMSAFTIGEAVLTAEKTRNLATASADMYVKFDSMRIEHVEKALTALAAMLMNKVEYTRVLAALTVEQRRIQLVAKGEEERRNAELDLLDAKWDIDLFQYGSNALAGIAGAATVPGTKSTFATALGGALSGAAAGMLLANETGNSETAGGVIGGILGMGAAMVQ